MGFDRWQKSAIIADIMSRRKEANRAEAIVKGIGGIILLLILGVMVYVLPNILKGKSPNEMLPTMLHVHLGFTLSAIAIGVIGLIVWVKVLKGTKKRAD